ncbi:MAG: flagellar assembly protein A, partial [Spirochaetota bacterium]
GLDEAENYEQWVEKINADNKILYSSKTTGVVFLDEVENKLYVEEEKDGDFSININNKGEVLLTINPPIGRKEAVTKKSISDEINNLKLNEIINQESLDKAVEIGKEDRIRDFVIGSKTPENYSININITDSNMTAYISIHRPIIPIQPITETMLMKEIIQAGIKKGILDKKIKQIIETINEKRESITDMKIAQGKKPVDDEEDFINFNINIEHKNQKFMIEDENGRQISKTGDIGEYVQAHTLLCQFVMGELKGNEGFTVTGEVLKPKRKIPKKLMAGKNVSKKQESNNRFDYYSQDEGNVYIYEDTIMVQKAK